MWAERVAELKQHIENGLTRGAIAQIYGVSRNAIIGACHRHGLSTERNPINQIIGSIAAREKRKRERPTKQFRPARRASAPVFPADPGEPIPIPVSLLDLNESHCHWVCEGTDDHCLPTYCGHPSVDGRWCAHHYRRVYA